MSAHDVSIIIPTFNRACLIHEAIDSCLRQQQSSGLGLQVVVVDDCSTDGTYNTLQEYGGRIECIRLEKNGGQCQARNFGLAKATGRYVKFLDSDDVLEDGVLTKEVEMADAVSADIVVTGWGNVEIGTNGRRVAGTERRWAAPEMEPLPDTVLWGRAVPTSSGLYKRSYIEGLEWDAALSKLDDWDWFCRAALRLGRIARLDSVSYWMREHAGDRITSTSTMIKNAREHHIILNKIEKTVREREELTGHRARQLAKYYYKELRVLSLHDKLSFEKAVARIRLLDPRFVPGDAERRGYMRLLARTLGFRRATLLHSFVKRRIKRV